MKEENVALASHLTEVQAQKQDLQAQLARLQEEWSAANSNNLRLMEEVSTKRNSLQVMWCPRTEPCILQLSGHAKPHCSDHE